MSLPQTKTILSFGLNDVDYLVCIKEELPKISEKRRQKIIWKCPYYQKWFKMLDRCYGRKKNNSYEGCFVNAEWKSLSSFRSWVDSQPNKNWEDCDLDKDLMLTGNKEYCSECCMFISPLVNGFINQGLHDKKCKTLIGVTYHERYNKFQSRCNNPFTKKSTWLGYFNTELEAHKAWQAKKHEYACQLADLQDDPRVAGALRQRYSPDKDWTNK